MGLLSTYYTTLMIAWGYSIDVEFGNQAKYPYLASIMSNSLRFPPLNLLRKEDFSLGYITNKVLEYFEWTRVSVLYKNNEVDYCQSITSALEVGERLPYTRLILVSRPG